MVFYEDFLRFSIYLIFLLYYNDGDFKIKEQIMARTEAEIHSIELLLTLDYLLHETDENHPAKATDICRYGAKNYHLKYNGGVKGDEIKRQRIGSSLKFLEKLFLNPNVVLPFVLETTSKNKYYIEQRNGLSCDQVAAVLAAIKNDRYTKDEDVEFLIERVLDAFGTSALNKRDIEKQYKKLIRVGSKFDKETLRKLRLIEKAYLENKLIKVRHVGSDPKNTCDLWYLVYFIKEYNNEPHAFLIPVSKIPYGYNDYCNYIFDSITNINIPQGKSDDLLCTDSVKNRDINELFFKQNPRCAHISSTVDGYLEYVAFHRRSHHKFVSFYFNLASLGTIKNSFENFFCENFVYQRKDPGSIDVPLIEKRDRYIKVLVKKCERQHKTIDNEGYGFVNMPMNIEAFKAWLLTDPFKDGEVTIADMITVIKPEPGCINRYLSKHYLTLFKKSQISLSDEAVEKIFDEVYK